MVMLKVDEGLLSLSEERNSNDIHYAKAKLNNFVHFHWLQQTPDCSGFFSILPTKSWASEGIHEILISTQNVTRELKIWIVSLTDVFLAYIRLMFSIFIVIFIL